MVANMKDNLASSFQFKTEGKDFDRNKAFSRQGVIASVTGEDVSRRRISALIDVPGNFDWEDQNVH